jgi:hypothetical protein
MSTSFFRSIAIPLLGVSVVGCASVALLPEAGRVELINEPPDRSSCEFVGEVVGSQGNWVTGDYTSNKNLVVGARNELRNEASKLGANVVHVQDHRNTSADTTKLPGRGQVAPSGA